MSIPLNLIELHLQLSDFVSTSTQTFDDSHSHTHMKKVVENSFTIIENDSKVQDKIKMYPQIEKLVLEVAWLHDVRDHKYPDSISELELEEFVKSIEPEEYINIIDIINNISFSKENKGLRKSFPEPYNTVLEIVGDADRLEAIGTIGIERCEIFTRERGGQVPKDVIFHCHEKLLRLLPEGFIKTEHGRIMALPLHEEIVDYIRLNEQ